MRLSAHLGKKILKYVGSVWISFNSYDQFYEHVESYLL